MLITSSKNYTGCEQLTSLAILNNKLKRSISWLTLICLIFFLPKVSFTQISLRDSVSLYTQEFANGDMTFGQLDSALGTIFINYPEATNYNHYYKIYQRSMAFWKDRLDYNASGQQITGLYEKALIEFLETPTCPNGDLANWKYAFKPNPVNDILDSATLGQCTNFGNHTAGIVYSVYMSPIDSNIILAGSNTGGLWRTIDRGENWECVTDHFRIPALGIYDIIDLSKPTQTPGSVLIALTGKSRFHDSYSAGVLKSVDGGINWTRHNLPINVHGVMPILIKAIKPSTESNLVYAISSDNIFYSEDQGTTWAEIDTLPSSDGKYYGLSSSSNGSVNKIYVTTKGGNAKIWTTETDEIEWTDITEALAIEGSNALDVDIDETFAFTSGYDGMDTNSYTRISLDTTYIIRDTIISGDRHLKVPSLTFDGLVGSEFGGLYLIHDFGEVKKRGEITISCNASIPNGCKIEFYIATIGNIIENDIGIEPAEGSLIGAFSYTGSDAVSYRSDTFTIPDGTFMDRLIVRFSFTPPYLYGSSIPIVFDDLRIQIAQEGPEISPHTIGISESNGSEIYTVIEAYDSTTLRQRLMLVKSTNNGVNWNPHGSSRGFPVNHRLPSVDKFTVSYDLEDKFYLGGNVKFVLFNAELTNIIENCTQHDDVRDVQVVNNIGGINHILVGDDGGVSYSVDGGFTWSSLNGTGLPITQFYDISINPNDNIFMMGGTQDNGTFYGTQNAWSMIGGGDGNMTGFSPNPARSDEFFYQVNETTIVKNETGTIYSVTHDFDSIFLAGLNRPSKYSPITGNKLYEGVEGKAELLFKNGVLVIHDLNPEGGYSPYTTIDFGSPSRSIGDIEISAQNESVVYVAEGIPRAPNENKKLFISTDFGLTFTDIGATSTAYVKDENGDSTSKKIADIFDWRIASALTSNPANAGEIWIGMSGVQRNDLGEVTSGLFRVLHSIDSGKTWNDYSAGLPPFPINDIIYQNETNDRLFAATDVGIFYREEGMSEWVCFQEGMPATFASDLEINYCTQELFAGTFGRGIWKSALNFPETEPVVISENLTWGGTQSFDHDIIIESGNTLTLTGTLQMAGSKHIIVEPGARLKVDGGVLTNACGAFWGGVIVQGDFSLEQTPTNQGVVTLLNGALIENATVGVALWQPGDWTSTGGIIYSSNATFKNNKKDVEFIQYTNHNGYGVLPNVSRFTNTTFTWTDDFMEEFPLGHVTMYWVDGVRFTACDFKDERTSPASRYQTDYGRNNSGIYSLDAHYYVLAGCSDLSGCTGAIDEDVDWRPCTFTNLDFGIYAANNVTENAITVDRTVFTNNLYGVQTVNVNGPSINRNQFNYTNVDNNFETYTSYGVHLIRSGGIKVEENELIDSSSTGLIVGIIASDLGETEELLYKNEFYNIGYGIIAQGKNRGVSLLEQKGLQFQCNDNVGNTRDHLVLGILWDGPVSPYYGVKALNGSSTNPSGNTFSEISGAVDGEHYSNQFANGISYFYYNGEADEEPLDYLGDIVPLAGDEPNSCLTHLTEAPYISYSGSGIAPYKTDFNDASAILASKKAVYASLLNGGNTSALIAAIASMTTSNASIIRTNLLNASPYLTDAVVRAALDKSNAIFPNSWGYELVMENIEVAYNSDFIDFLSTKTNPMPSWMIEDIEYSVAAGTSTDMLLKQSELAELEKVKSYAANQILNAFKNDTTGIEIDSLRNWVTQKNDLLVQTRIIDTYLHEGDYSTATAQLAALESSISSYPTHVHAELTDYVSYKEKMVALLSTESPLDSLSTTNYTFVENQAKKGVGIARYQAQELLCFFYGNCAEYPLLIPQSTQSMAQIIPSEVKRAFQVYPNPATDWVTIVMPEVEGQVQMTITDLTGRVILVETITKNLFNWDTKTMSNGTYLITLINLTTGERIGAEKVVLQH
jgi:hypothetical protein